ncbi:MAG: hypothetical protein ACRDJW_21100 [Thermomicrobiales bacterium]
MRAKVTLDSTNAETKAHPVRSLQLHRRFLLAAIADASLVDDIPNGVNLSLVPTDDPALAEQEIELGLTALRQGRDVYFKHIRLADLPHPPVADSQRTAGLKRTAYNWDGSIHSVDVMDDEGHWHSLDPIQGEPPLGTDHSSD